MEEVNEAPLLVAAIARQASDVLLVRQYGPAGPDTTWALPGGRCEPGELLIDALRREFVEETGLDVEDVLGMAYVAQLDNPTSLRRDAHEIPVPGTTATVVAFEVRVGGGVVGAADPDGFVSRAEWVAVGQAARLLAEHPMVFTGVPAADRVTGRSDAPPGIWQFRRQPDGTDTIVVSGPSIKLSPR